MAAADTNTAAPPRVLLLLLLYLPAVATFGAPDASFAHGHCRNHQLPRGRWPATRAGRGPPAGSLLRSAAAALAMRDVSAPPQPSAAAVKFDAMMGRAASYSGEQLAAIKTPRLRQLLLGVQDAAATPPVVEAFKVLYEDYLPIRTVGEFIFRRLDDTVAEAAEAKARQRAACSAERAEVERLVGLGQLAPETAAAQQRVFETVDRDGDGRLGSRDDLTISATLLERLPRGNGKVGAVRTAAAEERAGRAGAKGAGGGGGAAAEGGAATGGSDASGAVARFLAACDADNDGVVTLTEFVVGTRAVFEEVDVSKVDLDEEFEAVLLAEATAKEAVKNAAQGRSRREGEKKARHTARFNEMVETFKEWEDRFFGGGAVAAEAIEAEAAAGGDWAAEEEGGGGGGGGGHSQHGKDSRLRVVLAGCFAGARVEGVVTALRIVYEDFSPLRMAGDLIFNLMKKVVAMQHPQF